MKSGMYVGRCYARSSDPRLKRTSHRAPLGKLPAGASLFDRVAPTVNPLYVRDPALFATALIDSLNVDDQKLMRARFGDGRQPARDISEAASLAGCTPAAARARERRLIAGINHRIDRLGARRSTVAPAEVKKSPSLKTRSLATDAVVDALFEKWMLLLAIRPTLWRIDRPSLLRPERVWRIEISDRPSVGPRAARWIVQGRTKLEALSRAVELVRYEASIEAKDLSGTVKGIDVHVDTYEDPKR